MFYAELDHENSGLVSQLFDAVRIFCWVREAKEEDTAFCFSMRMIKKLYAYFVG